PFLDSFAFAKPCTVTVDGDKLRYEFQGAGKGLLTRMKSSTDPVARTDPDPPPVKPIVKPAPPPPAERKPIPKDADLIAADKLIKEVFKEDYAKTTRADKLTLAQKLLEQLGETKEEPARYVLFREVVNLATQAGDLNQAIQTADKLSKEFAVSSA